jgi:protoporphyrinogen/coproporphyrinogen III oxidase
MKRVVVAGGGIAGLSVAWALRSRAPQVDVVVLERAGRPGGNIRTERIDGYLCEAGPDGFLDSAPATLALVRALGLQARLQPSDEAARHRFVFRAGHLHEIPATPLALAMTGLLTVKGKLRLACEPFAPRRR